MLINYLKNYFVQPDLAGMELHGNSVKILALQVKNENFIIKKLIIKKLHHTFNHSISTLTPDLCLELAQLVAQEQLSCYHIALSVPDNLIMKKTIYLPSYLHPNSLYEEILTRLIEYFPGVNHDELQFDFVIGANNAEGYTIELYALYYAQVKNLLNLLAQANLTVVILDSDLYARARAAIWYLQHHHNQHSVIIIDITNNTINFMVVQHKQCIFNHTWHTDTEPDFNLAVKQAWLLAQDKAPLTLNLIGLSGDKANLDFLAQQLAGEFIVPVEIIAPISIMLPAKHIAQDLLHQYAPQLLLCTGLAMRLGTAKYGRN